MSEPPPPRCKQTFESFSGSFRFDPLEHTVRSRSEVTPTLPPARAAQVAQARQTERRDLSTRANDQIAPWIPANYSTPQGVLVAPVTSTQTTANIANAETALSQARFNTPPPELSAPPPPSPRSAHGDMSLDELATSAFASDALLEAVTGPTEMTLVESAINFSGFSQCVCSLIVSYAPRALPHTYAPCRAVGRDPQGSRGDAPT